MNDYLCKALHRTPYPHPSGAKRNTRYLNYGSDYWRHDSGRRQGFLRSPDSDSDFSSLPSATERPPGRSGGTVRLGEMQYSIYPGHLSRGTAAHATADARVARRRLRRHDHLARIDAALDRTSGAVGAGWLSPAQAPFLQPHLSGSLCEQPLDRSGHDRESAIGMGPAGAVEENLWP